MIRSRTVAAGILLTLTPVLTWAESPPDTDRTVDYYVKNPWTREQVLRKCVNDPGRLQSNPDCINAKKADEADAAQELGLAIYNGRIPSPEYYSWDRKARSATLFWCRKTDPRMMPQHPECKIAEQSLIRDQDRSGPLPQTPAQVP